MINEICPDCDCCFEPVFGKRGKCPGCGLSYSWDMSEDDASIEWADEEDDCDCEDDHDLDSEEEAY